MSRVEKHLTRALRENAPDLLRFFSRRIDREDAADAVSEVMTAAWSRIDALPRDAHGARLWLFGIARNVLLHAQRGEIRRSQLADKLRTEISAGFSRSAPSADHGLEVRDALARLDDDLAELVRLVHWDGLTLVDAAALLGIPASTARGRYQRARERLREALSDSSAGDSAPADASAPKTETRADPDIPPHVAPRAQASARMSEAASTLTA